VVTKIATLSVTAHVQNALKTVTIYYMGGHKVSGHNISRSELTATPCFAVYVVLASIREEMGGILGPAAASKLDLGTCSSIKT